MKEYKILKFLDKISFIFKSGGVDYPLMKKILQIKLVMDERRVPTVMMNNKKHSESKNAFRSSLYIYAFVGLFIGFFQFLPFPLFLKMNIIIGMLMFMLMTTMISDFSAVLLDIEDKNILLPRPVDAKTLNMAKLIHILIYLISIALAITGGTLVFGSIKYGILFLPVMLVEMIFICGFAILFTSIFYYAILTIFSGEKLKDMINYFQIALTIFMTVFYQLIGRIYNLADISVKSKKHIWDFILPTAWFAAPFQVLLEKNFDAHYIILSILGMIFPVITILLYVKLVAPHFEKNLQKLNNNDANVKQNKSKKAWQGAVCNILCKASAEKVFFRFTLQMLTNERKLKLRMYPLIALSVIFPFIMIMNIFSGYQSFSESFQEVVNGRYYLYMYYTVGLLSSLFPMISLSENYRGAWIYKVLPIEKPAILLKGALKAFVYKYILPVYLFMSILFLVIFGSGIGDDLVLIFINMLLLILVMFLFSKKELPFYKDFQYAQNGSNTAKAFLGLFLCGAVAFIHYLAIRLIPFGVEINIIVSLVIVALIWRQSFKITWQDLENNYE
jgi:hypothetical protein